MISAEDFLRSNPIRIPTADPAQPVSSGVGESEAVADDDSGDGRSVRSRGRKRTAPRRGGFGSRGTLGEGPENPQDADACREAALCLLDAAPRSSGEMFERLERKGYAGSTIADVVNGLIRSGLIDDEQYARSMVRYCLSRHLGERGTVREMMGRGVDRSLASRVASEAAEEGEFVESAYELGRVVARRTQGMERERRLRRLWSAGGRKGHDPSLIRQVAADLFRAGDDDDR